MKLTVFERAVLVNVLPKEGNFKTLKTVRKLREDLSLTEEEGELYKVAFLPGDKDSPEGKMTWKTVDDDGTPIPQEKEIEVSKLGSELIQGILEKLNEQGKLTMEHYSLYEKFIEPS